MNLIENDKFQMILDEEKISDLPKSICSVITYQAQKKGIEFFYENRIPSSQTIQTDISRFKQLLNNLLQNSLKFTEKGYISLLISPVSEKNENANSFFEIQIQDTRNGFNAEKIIKALANVSIENP